jgi:CheY-like chemotaxis protein
MSILNVVILGHYLQRGLEADGYRVRLAVDGGAAVEAFREDLPDLTILGLNLPIKDGERVLDEVRMVNSELPVMVLTARQGVETRIRCLDRGVGSETTEPSLASRNSRRSPAVLAGPQPKQRFWAVWSSGFNCSFFSAMRSSTCCFYSTAP